MPCKCIFAFILTPAVFIENVCTNPISHSIHVVKKIVLLSVITDKTLILMKMIILINFKEQNVVCYYLIIINFINILMTDNSPKIYIDAWHHEVKTFISGHVLMISLLVCIMCWFIGSKHLNTGKCIIFHATPEKCCIHIIMLYDFLKFSSSYTFTCLTTMIDLYYIFCTILVTCTTLIKVKFYFDVNNISQQRIFHTGSKLKPAECQLYFIYVNMKSFQIFQNRKWSKPVE